MDPKKKEALDALLKKDRRRLILVPLVIVLILAAASFVLYQPREKLGLVEARFQRLIIVPDDEGSGQRLMLELPDGRTLVQRLIQGDAHLKPGDMVCLAQSRHPLLRTFRYQRVPAERCA